MNTTNEAGWKLHPIGGDTGQAYMGTRNQEKVFLKRNTSPFLTTLALEGIAPKLIWTKRIENGDVLTAQVWCNGRTLEAQEMTAPRVIEILRTVHQSKTLRRLLEQVGGKYLLPTDLLDHYVKELPVALKQEATLQKTYHYLIETLDQVDKIEPFCASHGDVHPDNYLLSEADELFLVDWDNAVLADDAYDIGQLLARYIPFNQWQEWLTSNHLPQSTEHKFRMYWYALMVVLIDIKSAYQEELFHHASEYLKHLNTWLPAIIQKD